MKKRLIAVILCMTISIISLVVPVSAANWISDYTYGIDYQNQTITISAETEFPMTRVTLIVMNPGKALTAVESDPSALQYQWMAVTDESGCIKHSFPVNLENLDVSTNKIFRVYMGAPGQRTQRVMDVEYMSETSRVELLTVLKMSATEIAMLLGDEECCIAFGIKDVPYYDKLDLDALAKLLEGKFDEYELTADGFNKACKLIRDYCVLELFNNAQISYLFDDEGKYLLNDDLSFYAFDEVYETSLYECYENELSVSARKTVIEKVTGAGFTSPEDLYRDFAICTVLKGINSPETTGYAHVEKLLSKENRKFIGLDLSEKITGKLETKIASYDGEFKTVEELEKYIEGLFDEANNSNGSNNMGGSSGGSSGRGSVGLGGIVTSVDYVKPSQPETVKIFEDVPDEHWAAEAIAYLKAKGIVSGVGDNYFNPDQTVTREEFVKMVLAISNVELSNKVQSGFTDVLPDSWYAPYVITANEQGYINGISETQFGIGMKATRQDVCVIIYRIMNCNFSDTKAFADDDAISDYAKEAVSTLGGVGIINGYPDGSFAPTSNCTRAEAASIIYKAAKFMEVK